jgi:phospholipase/carboxylesterase
MPRFFRRLAEGVFDQQDLKVQTGSLVRFIGEASHRYQLRSDRIAAVGYSNGANIAASVLLTHPNALAAAVLFRPMVPFVPSTSPDLKPVNVLIAAGKRDAIASSQETQRLVRILENSGAAVTTFWHNGGHELGQDDLDAATRWLSEWRGKLTR